MSLLLIIYLNIFTYVGSNAYVDPHLSQMLGNETCSDLLVNFAYYASNFTLCAINYSRPIKMCETCITHYLNILEEHNKILNLYDSSGVHCKDKLINLDRLEVLEATYIYVSTLWAKGNCNNCFEKTDNGTLTSKLSNDTLTFQTLHHLTQKCLNDHYHYENKTYDNDVCANCSLVYSKMNNFYDKLKVSKEGGICMDIIDSMNSTRTCWSDKLGCDKKDLSTDAMLMTMILFIAVFPVIFYSSVKFSTKKSESKLLQQKRLAEQFCVSSTRRER